MNRISRTASFAILVAAGAMSPALAQQPMSIFGSHPVPYAGQVQDFLIPNQPGGLLNLSITGGDGRDIVGHGWEGWSRGIGGRAGTTTIVCRIGTGAGELAPGGTLRFIIGGLGEDPGVQALWFHTAYRGAPGGGGSGLLYRPPNENDWNNSIILAAAGGGGGGTIEGDYEGHDGLNAVVTGTCGANGVNGTFGGEGGGGCDGDGGRGCDFENFDGDVVDWGEGGGGAFTGGQSCCGTVRTLPGFPFGAAGHEWDDDTPDLSERGGWGFGAGGGAGNEGPGAGGGGYSGGGSGAGANYGYVDDAPGGGGCGYINSAYSLTLPLNPPPSQALVRPIDGSARLDGSGSYSFGRPSNDTPATAIAFTEGQTLSGTTATGDQNVGAPSCDPSGLIADVWYSYTNPDSQCTHQLSFAWTTPNAAVSLHTPGAIGTPMVCSNDGSLLTEVSPGQTVLVRVVTSLAPFSITTSGGIADADNDGICNNLDECPGGDDAADCNNNGVPDCVENPRTSRTVGQNFTATGHPYQLNGAAVLDAGTARLVNNAPNSRGTLVFHTLHPTDRIGSFRVDFDFKIGSAPGQINEGLMFAALEQTETSPWSLSSAFGEEIIATSPFNSLFVNFNTYNTGIGPDNSISVMRNAGPVGGPMAPSFDMDNAQWHHAQITWENFFLTIVLTPNGGSPETVFSQSITPFFGNPFFFAFAAGNADSTTTGRSWIDNVRIVDLSNDDDCDQDGIPDGCDPIGCQPPLNDECSGALPVGVGDTSFNNEDATGAAITACSRTDLKDIWFTYTPTCSGTVRFETIDTVTFLPTLAAYYACGSEEIQCVRNNAPGNDARIDIALAPGVPVIIRVAGYLFNSGSGVLRITYLSDADGDGVPDDCDVCPLGDDHVDSDGDGVADACDVCPGSDDAIDTDGDGIPDGCDDCGTTNDHCEDAILITEGNTFYCTLGATDEGPDLPGSCQEGGNSLLFGKDIWFRYVASGDGTLTVSTCNAADYDTRLAAYAGACGALTIVGCNDDFAGCGVTSTMTISVIVGEEYLIRVGGFGAHAGSGDLSVAFTNPSTNDDCSQATPISGVGVFNFDNSLATTDGVDDAMCNVAGEAGIEADVWYVWTSPQNGTVTVNTCGQTDVDTKIAAYAGATCPAGSGILACNDDICGYQSEISFTASANAQYLIRIGTYPGSPPGVGTFTISIQSCTGDLDGDGAVTLTDLSTLLAHFGVTSGATPGDGDLDGDGDVDLTDLATMLANFGTICP